ncbi:hypothetical protein JCM19238_2376 [Vibrio ponticus]|nr:hypothetical protein JCM19238_2376 [Vibrio ponticus]
MALSVLIVVEEAVLVPVVGDAESKVQELNHYQDPNFVVCI